MIEPEAASPPPDASVTPERLIREAALIALLALTLNLAGNGRTGLWDRDEPRYATCTREMRQRNDWLFPTFNGLPRYHKPILIYWLMRAGMAVGGDNPFGARLVSAFAGAGTCLLVWGLGRRMLNPRAGRLAALMLATAPIMVVESKLATTDATLAFCVVAGQCCLWELGRRESPGAAVGFWVAMAAAALTKGPIGPALIAASGAASWWWGGPTACWRRLRWRRGLPGFLLLTLPWYLAIGLISRGEFFRFAAGNQGLGRLANGIEQHGAPPGYYLASSVLLFYPWSALIPAAILGAWARRKGRPEFGFLLGWVVGPWLVLEAVPTKLFHYFLPSYPACALLASWLVGAVADEAVGLRRWTLGRLGVGILAVVGIAAIATLLACGIVGRGEVLGPCLAMAAVLAVGTLLALERLHYGATERAVHGLAATWAALLLLAGAWLLPAAGPSVQLSKAVGERLSALAARERASPMMGNFQPPGIVYALGRPAPTIRERDGLVAQVRREPVAVALSDREVEDYRKDPRLVVDVRGTVRGLNVEKGTAETLRMVVLRPSASGLARFGQQLDVK